MQQGSRCRRAAGDVNIHGDNVIDASEGCVALTEYAAVASAIADSNHQLRRGRSIIGPEERISMFRATGPVTSSMSAKRGDAVKCMPNRSQLYIGLFMA